QRPSASAARCFEQTVSRQLKPCCRAWRKTNGEDGLRRVVEWTRREISDYMGCRRAVTAWWLNLGAARSRKWPALPWKLLMRASAEWSWCSERGERSPERSSLKEASQNHFLQRHE